MVAAANWNGVRLFVYALCEPDGKTVRYIGLSANLWRRLHNHYRHSCVPRVREWIHGLRRRGVIPAMLVVREVYGIEAGAAAEMEEIAKHRELLGDELLNDRGTDRKRTYARGRLTYGNRSLTVAQWARELGITRQALSIRLQSHSPEVALSRGKLPAIPLEEGKRLTPDYDPGRETIIAGLEVMAKTGLSHPERRERRRMMAEYLFKGVIREEVATTFGVTTATVDLARKEFLGTSALRAAFGRAVQKRQQESHA
jgi:transposase-like protein